MVLWTVFILGGILILCVYYSQKNKQSSQLMHFDLLDENGDPIKKETPRITVIVNPNRGEDATVQELQYFCIKDKGYHVSVWPKNQPVDGYIEFNIAGMSHRDNIDNYLGEFVATL